MKRLVKGFFSMFGYDMRKSRTGYILDKKRLKKPGGWDKENLNKPGINPTTVIDVGVDNGTPALYKAFPDKYHILIEALDECEDDMKRILETYKGHYFLVASGAEDGNIDIYVDPAKKARSSVGKPTIREVPKETEKRSVPIRSLDSMYKEFPDKFVPPFGLKIDTEGFELEVVKGATELLKDTQFVIAETNILPRHEDTYSFAEFIAEMDKHGFQMVDMLNRAKGKHYLNWSDAYFVRKELVVENQ